MITNKKLLYLAILGVLATNSDQTLRAFDLDNVDSYKIEFKTSYGDAPAINKYEIEEKEDDDLKIVRSKTWVRINNDGRFANNIVVRNTVNDSWFWPWRTEAEFYILIKLLYKNGTKVERKDGNYRIFSQEEKEFPGIFGTVKNGYDLKKVTLWLEQVPQANGHKVRNIAAFLVVSSIVIGGVLLSYFAIKGKGKKEREKKKHIDTRLKKEGEGNKRTARMKAEEAKA